MSVFLSNFYFCTRWCPSKIYEKCFLFHLKSSWHPSDIQIFVFPSFPLFLPVDHCSRGRLKTNLKVYDGTNCLNKNLITHFVWYLEKEKGYDIETLSIDGVSDKEHFYICKNIFVCLFSIHNTISYHIMNKYV